MAICGITAITYAGGLEIKFGDVQGNRFVYTLDYKDMDKAADKLKFENDIWENTNFFTWNEGPSGARYIAAKAGETKAQLIYRFDFSASGYTVKSMSLRDIFIVWDSKGDEGTTVIAEWSTDNDKYHFIRSAYNMAHQTESGFVGAGDTVKVDLPAGTRTVYYRLTATVNEKDADGKLSKSAIQWNREGNAEENYYFKADFQLTR